MPVRPVSPLPARWYPAHEKAQAPPLVLLHGFMGSREDWDGFIHSHLAAYDCLAVDLPGHGAAAALPPEVYSFDATADALAATLDAYGLDRVVPVGYSMGGRIALYFARRHTERCAGLVLESASPGLRTEAERTARRAVDVERAARLRHMPLEEFLAEWYAMPLFASLHRDPERFAAMLRRREANDPAALGRALHGLGTGEQPGLWERLPELRVATCIISGALDAKFVSIGAEMATLFPHATHHVVPDAGHVVHDERPGAFRQLLLTYLDLLADGY